MQDNTPSRTVRVSGSVESAARRGAPELAALDFTTLARVGLFVLAGMSLPEAIEAARTRPGPKTKTPA
jgi:hypothetical protein